MNSNQFELPDGILADSVPSLSESTKIGETNIWAAIKAGELKTKKLIISGKARQRRIILRKDAIDWLDSFPDYDENAA